MRESIYMPFFILQPIVHPSYYSILLKDILKIETPNGIKIVEANNLNDSLIRGILTTLDELNPCEVPIDKSVFDDVPEYLMELMFEVEEHIHLKELLWLEDQLNKTFLSIADTGSFFYFYLMDDGQRFKSRNVTRINSDEVKVIYDQDKDDLSYIQQAAPFLAHYWYKYKDEYIGDAFPNETAKYLLLYG